MYNSSLLPARGVSSVLQVLGILCTTWRIYFRLRIDRFWWEDAWAAIAMLFCLSELVGEWISLFAYNSSPDNLPTIVAYWLHIIGYISAIRASHLSILFSIIRIIDTTRLGRFTYFCAACCGIFWAVALFGTIGQCASDPSWHNYGVPACQVKIQTIVFESVSDCLVVGILVGIPLRVLWRVRLPTRQRRMILSIFASSIVLAFVAIFHAIGRLLNITALIVVGMEFEVALSVVMCNMLVVVTYVYRYLRHDRSSSKATTTSETDVDTDDFTRPTGRPARTLLTGIETDSSISTTQQYTTHVSLQDNFDSGDSSVYV